MPDNNETIRIFIETPSGERFEADVPVETPLNKLAADFFESQEWPTTDTRGRGQRAVVEVVDSDNPDRTKRLRGEQTLEDTGLGDESILRIFPEAIAGAAVDERERIRALVADHEDMKDLVEWNTHITSTANMSHAPTQYTVTFKYPSFSGLSDDGHTPVIANTHQVEITMGAEYPRRAPFVRWLTPIFHPNIDPADGEVCLGVLRERYLPGLGLARIVNMLAEMVQFRNFDMSNAFNRDAAAWTLDSDHWEYIQQIGGSPIQGPVHELFKQFEADYQGEGTRPRIEFTRTRNTV